MRLKNDANTLFKVIFSKLHGISSETRDSYLFCVSVSFFILSSQYKINQKPFQSSKICQR